jgi:hypothetical protein
MFIEHPLENSLAFFNFTSAVPNEVNMFTFGSWVCIANGLGGFNNHMANPRSQRHVLRHPEATSTILPMISTGSNFPI